MGRLRKPTALHIVEGTAQPCRMNPDEPVVEIGAAACPDWLTGDARDEWNFLVPRLVGSRVLSPMERSGLISLCMLTAKIYEAGRKGEILGPGYIGQHRALLAEFGLTPSSRSKVRAQKEEKSKNQWSALAKRA